MARRATLFLMLLLFFSQPCLLAEELPPGQIFDPLPCLHDAGQSYVLYLPTAYQPERRWPVMYCFDPGGRGATPVALFREGAEKYGYILVGSNNSKNGPWEIILQAARAIWRDSHARLAVDDQRIYAAGFSGGARAACGLGKILSIKLNGVIACGAGLPEWLTAADLIDVPWFGTTGLYDINYTEMRELAGRLDAQATPQRLKIFPGRHSWPPPELALAAVEWLELQAMKCGSLPRNDEMIAAFLSAAMEQGRELEDKQEWGSAFSQYTSIVDDFTGLADVTAVREKAGFLKKKGAVKEDMKNESSRESEYQKSLAHLKAVYLQLRGPLNEPGKARKIINELKIPALKKKAAANDLRPEQIIAKRLLAELSSKAISDGQTYLDQKDGPRATITFQIASQINPGHPNLLAALAGAIALNGERKKALKTLSEAIAAGFNDYETLENDSIFAGLRSDPEFLKIIASLKKSPGPG